MTVPFMLKGCAAITETLYPSSDVSDGSWQGTSSPTTSLFASLDSTGDTERVFSNAPGDACPTKAQDTFEVHVANPVGEPGPSDCQQLVVRWRGRKAGADAATGECDLTVYLVEGTTIRASQLQADVATGFNTYTLTLGDAQYDAISNHDDLRIRIQADFCFANELESDVFPEVSYARLEYTEK